MASDENPERASQAGGTTKVLHYKQLEVWKKGTALVKAVHELARKFPQEERFGLTLQMRRAAVSVPCNIAEGQARQGRGEFLQYLSHASGSLAEIETQRVLSEGLGFCSQSEAAPVKELVFELQRMLAAMRSKLRATGLPLATRH